MMTTTTALLTFPCEFPIKIMGKATAEFENFALAIVQTHFPTAETTAVQRRLSKDGNFLSITLTVQAQSQPQLDAVYQALTANPLCLMAL